MPRRIDMRGRQHFAYPIGSGSPCTMRPIWNSPAASGCRWLLWTGNSRAPQPHQPFRCVAGHRSGSLSRSAGRVIAQPHQQLAEVLSLEQPDEGFRGMVEAVDDVLAVFEMAALDEWRDRGAELGLAVALVADDEALDLEPLAHHGAKIGAGARLAVVVFGNHAAHHDAAKVVEPRKHRLLHRAADILEIDVDAFGAGRIQRGAEVGAAMVDRGIEAELVLDIAAFVGATGDADDPGALVF